jgi:hypothetical protein
MEPLLLIGFDFEFAVASDVVQMCSDPGHAPPSILLASDFDHDFRRFVGSPFNLSANSGSAR